MSDDRKTKGAEIIADLKEKLAEVDALANAQIAQIVKEAQRIKDDPESPDKYIDVQPLEDIIRQIDGIIYSPEVAGALAKNMDNAASIKIIIDTMRTRIRRKIKDQIIEKYSDVNAIIIGKDIEGEYVSYPDDSDNPEPKPVSSIFANFIEQNIDDSRVNYETRQLNLMKAAPQYSKLCDEKEARHEDYGGIAENINDLTLAIEDRKTTEMLIDKMKEYTPEKIEELKKKVATIKDPALIQRAYEAAYWMGEECAAVNHEFREHPSEYLSRSGTIKTIIYGNPTYEKDLPPELVEVVRYLSIQHAYARTLSSYPKDIKTKNALIACYKAPSISKTEDLLGILDQASAEIKTWTDRDAMFEGQKDRAFLETVKKLANINETIFVFFPEMKNVLEEFEAQDNFDGLADAYSDIIRSYVRRYNNHEFDQEIEEFENYVVDYRKLVDAAKLATAIDGVTPVTGDELYANKIEMQERLVQRYRALLERRKTYQATNIELAKSGVKESDSELDLINLSKPLSKTEGVHFIKNLKIEDVSRFSELPEERKKEIIYQVRNGMSQADYERIRAEAFDYYQADETRAKALVETNGNFFVKAWDWLRNTWRNIFGNRNFKTKREIVLNNYIEEEYIKPMLEANEKIQKQHAFVKSEREEIKEEDIRLKNIDSERARKKRENTALRDTKYQNVPKAKKADQVIDDK